MEPASSSTFHSTSMVWPTTHKLSQEQPVSSPMNKFLDFPPELWYEIVSHLGYPERPLLRTTHPFFRQFIGPFTDRLTHAELLHAERTSATIAAVNYFSCCMCIRMLPAGRFDEANSTKKPAACFPGDDRAETNKERGGSKAAKRFCISCCEARTARWSFYEHNRPVTYKLCYVCCALIDKATADGGGADWRNALCSAHMRHGETVVSFPTTTDELGPRPDPLVPESPEPFW